MNAHIASLAPAAHHSPARPIRFAVALTAAVAVVAWFLAAVAKLSEEVIVLSTIVVAFAASWIATSARTDSHRHHRVTLVRVRTRIR
ncbi:MAG: hypothetical protein ABIR32_08620 [Ilumatobacteraceae bacterium]